MRPLPSANTPRPASLLLGFGMILALSTLLYAPTSLSDGDLSLMSLAEMRRYYLRALYPHQRSAVSILNVISNNHSQYTNNIIYINIIHKYNICIYIVCIFHLLIDIQCVFYEDKSICGNYPLILIRNQSTITQFFRCIRSFEILQL